MRNACRVPVDPGRLPGYAPLAAALLVAIGCSSGAGPEAPPAPGDGPEARLASGEQGRPGVEVTVSRTGEAVTMVAGPFEIPASGGGEGGHHHHGSSHGGGGSGDGGEEEGHRSPLLPIEWPVAGWLRGFEVGIYDGRGNELDRDILHHLIAVNFERRQVAYPIPERIFGIGQETNDVILPDRIGVPLERGDRVGIYASWHNDTGGDLDEVYVRMRIPFAAAEDHSAPREVLPIWMDTNFAPGESNAYDLPPGRSERSQEFEVAVSGYLLGVSGHLHDHGEAVRLEDAETGEVLAEVEGIEDDEGNLVSMEEKVFRRFFGLLDTSVRLEAGRTYRVVGVYDSPLDEPIPNGAMAHMVGVFEPDTWTGWSAMDAGSPDLLKDLGRLPEPLEPVDGLRWP